MSELVSTTLDNSYRVLIHGGSFVYLLENERLSLFIDSLTSIIQQIQQYIESHISDPSFTAIDIVEFAIRLLEDDPLYNAGKGSVFTNQSNHVLEASLMDGRNLAIGAVSQIEHYPNPITIARLVLETSPHNYLVGKYAEELAAQFPEQCPYTDNSYFSTERRREQWHAYSHTIEQTRNNNDNSADFNRNNNNNSNNPSEVSTVVTTPHLTPQQFEDSKKGTVGCVVVLRGNVAAGTSTGGMTGKNPGRIGDSPIIGAGTYAENSSAALSLTGSGEEIMRYHAAGDIVGRMRYGQQSLQQATEGLLTERLPANTAGVIGVTAVGDYVMQWNSRGMLRAMCSSEDRDYAVIGIYEEELHVPLR